jgi:MATE family multidrug resistance protein
MSAINVGVQAPGYLWRSEIKATLALAWPMVLTNLGQTAMTATDVMMMGRLGPQTLAAGALGANLYFMVMILGLGLMLATSPMMASELGRKRHSVRDIRRTVRQGLWQAVLVALPIWLFLWHGEALLLAMGQEPELARLAGIYLHWLQWAVLPFYGYIILRSFISALERPGWALVIVFLAVAANALFNWLFMFGHLGFPVMGIAGSGVATTLSSTLMFACMTAVVLVERQFRRYRLFVRFLRADWAR